MSKLNIRCPLNMMLGYGNVSYNTAIALSSKFQCSLFPIGKPFLTVQPNKIHRRRLQEMLNHYEFDKNSPCLTIWHEFDLIPNHIGTGKMIGMPYWEINTLDAKRILNMSYCDDLIVSSQWAKEICERGSVISKIHVIPPGVDNNIFAPIKQPLDDKYHFFNIGKLEKRKGHDILHLAFQKAFDNVDDVCLHMMVYNPFINQEEYKHFQKQYRETLGDKVQFIEPVNTDEKLSSIINDFHCGVFPSRSEGFGLPILQSLACGKGIITTNYSAITEFCNKENSILMEVDEFEPAIDNKWFFGDSQWAKLNIDDLVHCLRSAYTARLGSSINNEGIITARKFTWENTAQKIYEMLH